MDKKTSYQQPQHKVTHTLGEGGQYAIKMHARVHECHNYRLSDVFGIEGKRLGENCVLWRKDYYDGTSYSYSNRDKDAKRSVRGV